MTSTDLTLNCYFYLFLVLRNPCITADRSSCWHITVLPDTLCECTHIYHHILFLSSGPQSGPPAPLPGPGARPGPTARPRSPARCPPLRPVHVPAVRPGPVPPARLYTDRDHVDLAAWRVMSRKKDLRSLIPECHQGGWFSTAYALPMLHIGMLNVQGCLTLNFFAISFPADVVQAQEVLHHMRTCHLARLLPQQTTLA